MTLEQIQWWAAAKYLAHKYPKKYRIVREYNIYTHEIETKIQEFLKGNHLCDDLWCDLEKMPCK